MFNEHDVVRLRQALPKEGIQAGDEGTIVHVFRKPYLAYEVEFADEDGQTVAMVPLTEDQVELVWSARTGDYVRPRAA